MSAEAAEQIHDDMVGRARWLVDHAQDSESRYHARMLLYNLEDRDEDVTEMFEP